MQLSNRQFNLMAVTAMVAVAPHLTRLPWWLGLCLILIAPLRMWSRQHGAKPVSAWWRIPLVAVLVIAIILQYGNLFGREPGSALAAGMLILKLVESERVRDARAALGFSAFVLMSALLFTQTLGFTLAVCASLILLFAALNSLEPAALSGTRPLRRELRQSGLLFGLGLPLAIAAFLLIPRLGSPLWGAPGLDQQGRIGLSDRMSPGSLTELLTDDTPALRARFDGEVPAPAARYFRALVLWDFDGSTWTREEFRRGPPESLQALSTPLEYEITLEPTDRPWLVALDLPLAAPENTRLTDERTLTSRIRVAQPRQYRVSSALNYLSAEQLEATDRQRALRLPKGYNGKTHELAAQWRSEGQDDTAIMRSALALFNASFTYTLSAPLLGRDSVDDFLFSTRAGYCEHFSSSFVFLMRAAGIPARVVTGYQGGWLNKSGNYLLVRNSDAHAWSEVWLAGRGWVRVDPTAAVSPIRIEQGAAAANDSDAWFGSSWLRDARNSLDIVNRLWTQTILQFNALRQKSLLTPFGIDDADQGQLLLLLACIVSLVMLIATFWVLRGGFAKKGDTLDQTWNRLRRRIARRGLTALDNEGPLDYLARIKTHFPTTQTEAIERLIQTYVHLRYAGVHVTAEQIDAFTRMTRELRLPRAVSGND